MPVVLAIQITPARLGLNAPQVLWASIVMQERNTGSSDASLTFQRAKWKSCNVIIRSSKKGERASETTGLKFLSESFVMRTYSTTLASSVAGLMVQSINNRSPSSELPKKVGVSWLGLKSMRERPTSPDPSYLKRLIEMTGVHSKSYFWDTLFDEAILISSFSICFVSQIRHKLSSEQVMQYILRPSRTCCFNTLIRLGMNYRSATKFLCDLSTFDNTKCLHFTACYWVLSSSSSGILSFPATFFPSWILWSALATSQATIWPFIPPPMRTLGFSGWNSNTVISTGVVRM